MSFKDLDAEGYYNNCDRMFYTRSVGCNTRKLAVAKNVNAIIMMVAGSGLYFGAVFFLSYFGLLPFTISLWVIVYVIGISFVFFLISFYHKVALWWGCKDKKPTCSGIDI